MSFFFFFDLDGFQQSDLAASKNNIIDNVSNYALDWLFGLCFPLCPLLLGNALSSVPGIGLASDLKLPKIWKKVVASLCFIIVGRFWYTDGLLRQGDEGEIIGISKEVLKMNCCRQNWIF